MCPLDVTMGKAMAYFEMFLPTFSVYENPDKTYRLWFEELLGFWTACGNNPNWEPALMGENYDCTSFQCALCAPLNLAKIAIGHRCSVFNIKCIIYPSKLLFIESKFLHLSA